MTTETRFDLVPVPVVPTSSPVVPDEQPSPTSELVPSPVPLRGRGRAQGDGVAEVHKINKSADADELAAPLSGSGAQR